MKTCISTDLDTVQNITANEANFGMIERMDYNWIEEDLFISDTVQHKIFKVHSDEGSLSAEQIIDLGRADCNGLAVDVCGRYLLILYI